jgi:hypothetical protein
MLVSSNGAATEATASKAPADACEAASTTSSRPAKSTRPLRTALSSSVPAGSSPTAFPAKIGGLHQKSDEGFRKHAMDSRKAGDCTKRASLRAKRGCPQGFSFSPSTGKPNGAYCAVLGVSDKRVTRPSSEPFGLPCDCRPPTRHSGSSTQRRPDCSQFCTNLPQKQDVKQGTPDSPPRINEL